MIKSVARDVGILKRMLEHQNDIARLIKESRCCTANALAQQKDCIDLCSFHMLNMYEEYKNLTEESKQQLQFIETGVIRELRNVIGHTYASANKVILASYAMIFSNAKSIECVRLTCMTCIEARNKAEL